MRKGKNAERCRLCGFRKEWCICSEIGRADIKARLIIIQHTMDAVKPSNTANIIRLASGCEIMRYGGNREEVIDYNYIDSMSPFILYPAEDSKPLSKELWIESGRPPLIALDGTWKQAARAAAKFAGRNVKFVRLPEGFSGGGYKLRKSGSEERLCTGEAVIDALKTMGEDTSVLEDALKLFINKNLLIRGRARDIE
ncbi:MAG: DTW domain-containing protein [bacterium]|nr:DTW domain-containing protein [bacterium]